MKRTLLNAALVLSAFVSAQNTGINTTNPTHTLDVNGDLRVRAIPDTGSGFLNYILGADTDGVIRKTTFAKYIVVSENVVAPRPVDVVVAKNENVDRRNIDLGVSRTVTVPAGQRYVVAMYYNVSVGQLQDSTTPANQYTITIDNGSSPVVLQTTYHGMVGAVLVRNGVAVPYASKKITMRPAFGGYVQPEIISNFYSETLDNSNGTTPMVVKYDLNGFVYHINDYLSDGVGGTIRFNGGNNIYPANNANIEYTGMTYLVLNLPLQ